MSPAAAGFKLDDLLVLFAILFLGSLLGAITVRGISIGVAGVLLAAMIAGHLGYPVPHVIGTLGLLLFVYAVGLQAGPRFFHTFRRQGARYLLLGTAVAGVGTLVAYFGARALGLPSTIAAGLLSGAMTCTPALAAATDVAARIGGTASAGGAVAVGYGVAYPYGMLGLVLLMPLLPKLLGRSVPEEEARWREEDRRENPPLTARRFQIAAGGAWDNRRVRDLGADMPAGHRVTLSRVRHHDRTADGGKEEPIRPDTLLRAGDVVTVVGEPADLDSLRGRVGAELADAPADAFPAGRAADDGAAAVAAAAADAGEHTPAVADVDLHGDTLNGKRLMDLGLTARGLVVTRIRRQGREIVPRGDVRLLYGDIVRVVGEPEAVRQFAREAHGGGANGGHSPAHAETSMLPFLLGLLLGVALGTLPIPLPGGGSVQISAAGGVFLVSLVIGYGGRVGPLALRVPPAAQVLSRELGLMLFLAGAGSRAGEKFAEVLAQYGVLPLLAGAAVTTAAAAVGVVLMHFVFRMNVLAIMGGLCACFTNPAALAAASKRTDTDLPALAYASIYPVALIVKIVLAQILVALGP